METHHRWSDAQHLHFMATRAVFWQDLLPFPNPPDGKLQSGLLHPKG